MNKTRRRRCRRQTKRTRGPISWWRDGRGHLIVRMAAPPGCTVFFRQLDPPAPETFVITPDDWLVESQ